jgi:hypothetical protein
VSNSALFFVRRTPVGRNGLAIRGKHEMLNGTSFGLGVSGYLGQLVVNQALQIPMQIVGDMIPDISPIVRWVSGWAFTCSLWH